MKKNKEKVKADRKQIKAKILAIEKEMLEMSHLNNLTAAQLKISVIVEMKVKTQLYGFIAAENLWDRYRRHVDRTQIGY